DAVGIAARPLRRLAHGAKAGCVVGRSRAEREPSIEGLAGKTQHSWSAAAQPDRRAIRSKGPRLQLETRLLISPQPPATFDGAQHCADPAVARNSKRRQLCMRTWQLRARADPDDEAPSGDAIEGGHPMRQRKRVPK